MEAKVSAIICTHNRAGYLRKAMASLTNQSLTRERYEILIVDNGSTDETKQVVLKEFSNVSNIRYIFEPQLGLCHARNTGWRNARGKYVAYLDDDGIACSNWLDRIVSVFESVDPTPACVGGKIEPIWEAPRPDWLPNSLLNSLAILDWSDNQLVLDSEKYLAGVNIAFTKTSLQKVDGFKVGLDRSGKNLLSNGDILVQRQIQSLGYDCVYDPEILVRHHVAASRLTKKWFVHRYYWQGVSDVLMNYMLKPDSRVKLVKEALLQSRNLIRALRGGYIMPKRIYWHIANITFPDWVEHGYAAGEIREKIYLALGGSRIY